MEEVSESALDYVIRKLSSKEFNLNEVAKITEIDRVTLSRIKDGTTKNPGSRTVQCLHDYFKSIAE